MSTLFWCFILRILALSLSSPFPSFLGWEFSIVANIYAFRLDGHRMLDFLRGKRLAFVGDSLNRNMWESLICILRNSVKDKSKVYEANGRAYFRGEVSYSFIFKVSIGFL